MKTLMTLLTLFAVLLAGCGKQDNAAAPPDPANTLSVLAGSELKDIEPLLPSLTQATGITPVSYTHLTLPTSDLG